MAGSNIQTNGKYVIRRASESRCEWWTGTGWTEDDTQAKRYVDEPRAEDITEDENATAQLIET
ncbi:MAG: hypothetical protein JWM11_905 [Planctomycetaceae bacterium]|nr:hypothetical protein [Planctomycetaceae bacterium]